MLEKRKCSHKINCYNENDKNFNQKLYQMIRENGGWDTFRMIEVEKNHVKIRGKQRNEKMK